MLDEAGPFKELLTRDGALVEESGRFRAVHKRATKTGAADILDRLADL